MREWPSNFIVQESFVGRQLEAIFFTENTVSLHFDKNTLVTITSDYVYSSSLLTEEICFPVRHTYLLSSIGSEIIKAELFNNRDLCLWFLDGAKLLINGSIKEYECYSVNLNGREFYI